MGAFIHCQMRYGEALISIGEEWNDEYKKAR